MIGRFLRLLIGLAVLAVCLDIFDPAAVSFAPAIGLGGFGDLRDAIAAALGVTGFAFLFSAALPSAKRRRRTPAVSALALAPAGLDGLEPPPRPIFETPAPVAEPATAEAAHETTPFDAPAHEVAETPAIVHELIAAPVAPVLAREQPMAQIAHEQPAVAEQANATAAPEPARPVLTVVPHEEPATPAWDIAPSPIAHTEDIAAESAPAPAGRAVFVTATEAGDKRRLDGDMDGAMDRYDEALELAHANAKAAPEDVQARADLAGALTNVGDIHDEQGRLESAIEAHEASLKLRRDMVAAAPADKTALRGLSLGLERLADTREARGHRSRALDLYQESLPIAQRLAADHPGEAIYAKDLEITQGRVDDLTREMAPPVMEPVED